MKKTFSTMLAMAAALFAQAEVIDLLTNGGGTTLDGWENSGFAIQTTDDVSWFRAGHTECRLSQTVTLSAYGLTESDIQGGPTVTASGIVQADVNKDGSGGRICNVKVYELDADGNEIATHLIMDRAGELITSEAAFSDSFQLNSSTRRLKYEINGQDSVNWDGYSGPKFRNCSLTIDKTLRFTFVSAGATLGTVSARNPPIPVRKGSSRFAGYYTAETGGVKVYNEKCEIDEDALSDLSPGATLYARWEAVEPSFGGFVYRGQLNTLSGQPAEGDSGATYTKTMHFRVYDGDSSTIPLWQSGARTVTVNADGSFVYKFGDDALTGLIATGRVSHVGVALGNNADTAVELKPRSALSSVSAVNRALAAEGAAVDVRIGNLVTENALVAADATFSHLDITGTVDAPATEVSVSPLTLGAGDRTRLLRGSGVNLFSSENPTVLKSNTGAVMKGQYLNTTAPYNGVVLFATAASGDRGLRCPAVVQFCRAGEKLHAPTSDLDGLKVIFFPFIGKEGE